MKLTNYAAAVAAVIAAGGLVMSGSATADEPVVPAMNAVVSAGPPSSAPCQSTTGSTACFQAYGDVVWVKDTKADSHHAAGFIQRDTDGTIFKCHNYHGEGVWGTCDWHEEIPEHRQIELWATNMEGDQILNSSALQLVPTT